jgi:hypothetical protein
MTSAPEGTARPAQSSDRRYSIPAMVLGVLALLIAPVITGGLAVILAAAAFRRKEALARWALAVAIVGTIVGITLYYGVRDNDFLQIY